MSQTLTLANAADKVNFSAGFWVDYKCLYTYLHTYKSGT